MTKPPDTFKDLAVVHFETVTQWEAWLRKNQARSPGIWIKLAKKGSKVPSITQGQAVDVALCYGWIDSQAISQGNAFWLQRFTRRGPRSKWSKINCAKAESFIAEGRMRAAGLAQIEAAKQDGRWAAAYAGQRTMTVPPDLQKALEANRRARKFFEGLDSKNRYAILFRIHEAKRPDTRARRIEKFVAMLSERKRIHESTE